MLIRMLLCAAGMAVLAGCACMTPETRAEEGAWLALHAVDTAQTVNFRHTPGVREVESAWIIGAKPKRASVYEYMGAMAALHVGAAAYMDAHDWPRWTRRLFEAVTIADAANCIRGNYALGVAAHF